MRYLRLLFCLPVLAALFAPALHAQRGNQGNIPQTPVPTVTDPVIYNDPAQPLEKRVADLVRRMSLTEKALQLRNGAPAIERLGVPRYDYWSEASHGVANQGLATVFPQAIGNAATWNPTLIEAMGQVIAVEGRGK